MKCLFLSIFSANCILNLSQDGRLVWLLSSFLLKMINVLYQEVVFESLSGRLLDGVTVVTFLAGRRNAARYFTFSPHTTLYCAWNHHWSSCIFGPQKGCLGNQGNIVVLTPLQGWPMFGPKFCIFYAARVTPYFLAMSSSFTRSFMVNIVTSLSSAVSSKNLIGWLNLLDNLSNR